MTWLTDLVHASLLSPWVYLAVFLFTALDAVLPLLPSETLVHGPERGARALTRPRRLSVHDHMTRDRGRG